MKQLKTLYLLPAAMTLASCTYMSQGFMSDENRGALIAPDDFFGDKADQIVYLDQNWDAADSLWFYNTTQGSNLMPLEIFLNLEQADNQTAFSDEANLRSYRYLTQKSSWDNPHGLPVGFVANNYEDKEYVGFTCAACHTNQINYQGYGVRVDGAPAMADMEAMLLDLEKALDATLADNAKFERLAIKIAGDDVSAQEAFREELHQVQKESAFYNRSNAPLHDGKPVRYGYARLDAFGRIYNRVLSHLTPNEDNFNPANAPVSYPFLWDTPQADFVQWNGVGDNAGVGPLGRNTGEVLGVFATFDLDKKKGDIGFRSSANARNLVRIERHLESLQSPQWPTVLPAINPELAAQGKEVFVEYRCHECHEDIDRSDPNRRVIAQFSSLDMIGTDRVMAENAFNDKGLSGLFEDKYIDPLNRDAGKFKQETIVLPALSKAATGVIIEPDHNKLPIRRWVEEIYDIAVTYFDNPIKETHRHVDFEVVNNGFSDLLAYKGRPLNGIWATAPYLHNGSVPNLYELFLPACDDQEINEGKACRSNTFTLGSREFDPVKVGFEQKDITQYPGLFVFDTSLPSNSNAGHEYAVGKTPMIKLNAEGKPVKGTDGKPVLEWLPPITDNKRLALVEYLKTL
jgi:RoxA-like, cytochrome c-like